MALTATQQSKLKAAGYKAIEIKAFAAAGVTAAKVRELIAKKAGRAAPVAKKKAAAKLLKAPAKAPVKVAAPRISVADMSDVALAREAVRFIETISPRQGPGFRFEWDPYHSLPQPAQGIVSVFERIREDVSKTAWSHRVGAPNQQTMGNDIAPVDAEAEMSAMLARVGFPRANVAKALRAAGEGLDKKKAPLLKEHLKKVADAWEGRASDIGWQSALALKWKAAEAPAAPTVFEVQQPAADVNFADVGTQSQQALYARRPADPFMSQIGGFDRYQGADLRSVATVDKITTAVESHFGVHIDWPTGPTGALRSRVAAQTKGKRPGSDLQIHSIHRVVVVKADRSAAMSGGDDVSILSTTTGKDLAKALVAICERATGQN